MRKFAALYSHRNDVWMVIFQDQNEEEWYVQLEDAGDQEIAKSVAKALNMAQKEA